MKIKNLLLLAAFLATSGGAMAQTTLTASNAKIVPGNEKSSGALTLSLTVPSEIAGWQAVISLPTGVSVVPDEDGKLTVGETTVESSETMNVPMLSKSVKLLKHTANHVVMGGIAANASGDGSIAAGDLVVICFPTVKDANISDASKGLCTISLKADDTFTGPTASDNAAEIVPNITVKSFQACDAAGNPDAEGKFKATDVAAVLYQLRGDVNDNGSVNVNDVVAVCKEVKAKTNQAKFDVNGNGKVNVNDVIAVCKEIKLK
jgi:hypothetical protein